MAAGIGERFEMVIDDVVAVREHLAGKPAPDTFLVGARALGLEPAHAGVFEDALARLRAGWAGASASSSASTASAQPDALRADGASVVVGDLSELLSS